MEDMTPRNLLAISWAMPPRLTPRALQVSRLLAAVSGLGWHVTVFDEHPGGAPAGVTLLDTALEARLATAYRSIHVADSALLNTLLKWAGRHPGSWEHLVALKADRLIARGGIDALVTFAQPFKDHLAGLRIRRRHPRLPWIAHFSDPWVDNPLVPYVPWRERQWEGMTVEQADALVFTTERTLDLVLRHYPTLSRERCHVLPHCFDSAAQPDAPASMGEGLHLVHAGNLYAARMPFGLLFALANLRKQGVCDIYLHCIGHAQPLFHDMSKALGLEEQVLFADSMPPDACLRECRRADVLLSCDAPAVESVFLPSKLVDYLAAQRPLLCITPEQSSSNDFIHDVGGFSVPPEDVAGMERMLLNLRRRKLAGGLSALIPSADAVNRYLPENAARHFAAIVEQAVHEGGKDA